MRERGSRHFNQVRNLGLPAKPSNLIRRSGIEGRHNWRFAVYTVCLVVVQLKLLFRLEVGIGDGVNQAEPEQCWPHAGFNGIRIWRNEFSALAAILCESLVRSGLQQDAAFVQSAGAGSVERIECSVGI